MQNCGYGHCFLLSSGVRPSLPCGGEKKYVVCMAWICSWIGLLWHQMSARTGKREVQEMKCQGGGKKMEPQQHEF